MDRPSRSQRHSDLRLPDQGSQQQEHGCILVRRNHENNSDHSHFLQSSSSTPPYLCAVREHDSVYITALFLFAQTESGEPDREHDEHRGYLGCRIEAVLESQGSYAGCERAGHGALPGDLGSDFCKGFSVENPFRTLADVSLDHWSTVFLPDSLGLDQALVRPGHHLQNLHSPRFRSEIHPLFIHGPLELSQEVRR